VRLQEQISQTRDVLEVNVYPRLSTRDLMSLSGSCRLFNELTLRTRKSSELMKRVICGEETRAESILESAPYLSLSRISKDRQTTDPSGQLITGLTPFQAALCAGDVEMCQMMEPYIDQLKNGREVRQIQFREIFPQGLEESVRSQKLAASAFDFRPIVNAITSATDLDVKAVLEKRDNGSVLCETLDIFRKAFKQCVTDELVYNPYYLLRVFEIYDEQSDIWGGDKRHLFWRNVIGFVERFMPVCYAQAFARGIYYIVEEDVALARSLNLRFGGESLYPLNFDFPIGLGFDYALGLTDGALLQPQFAPLATDGLQVELLTKFISSKNTRLGELLTGSPAILSYRWSYTPYQ